MANPRSPVTGRRLQNRVVENNRRLLDAGVATLAEDGWAAFTFQGVATRAGLSRRTLQNRYPSTSALAVDVWRLRCAPPLQAALDDVLACASEAELAKALSRINRLTHEQRAGLELLVISQFDGVLKETIDNTLGQHVRTALHVGADAASRATAARRAFLLSLALGLAFASRVNQGEDVDLTSEVASLYAGLQVSRDPLVLPKQPASYLRNDPEFDTDDPTLNALFGAVLAQVGTNGFERASVDRIAAAAGFTTGALFARYSTKLELFIDATRRQQAMAMPAAQEYMVSMSAAHGAGVGDALNIRESQRPALAHLRAIGLEQLRVSLHNDGLRKARQQEIDLFVESHLGVDPHSDEAAVRASVYVAVAIGIGIAVLPLLDPDCWSLPYDVVTVPLAQLSS